MIKNDSAEKDKTRSAFNTHIFSCPICRQTTLLGWYYRPINRLILKELRQTPEYEQAYERYKKQRGDIPKTDIPENVDLAAITNASRNEKVETLYKEILTLLFTAASEGKPFIVISDKKKVYDIQLVADLLSKKLFEKNKIYKLVTTPTTCDIELIPSNRSYKSEYINPLVRGPVRHFRHARSLGSEPILSTLRTTRLSLSDNSPHI